MYSRQPSGAAPYPRYRHSATLIGSDLLIVGGMPQRQSERDGEPLDLLKLVHIEMHTSATIVPRLQTDRELNGSCTLYEGTAGTATQRWSCGVRLHSRR